MCLSSYFVQYAQTIDNSMRGPSARRVVMFQSHMCYKIFIDLLGNQVLRDPLGDSSKTTAYNLWH